MTPDGKDGLKWKAKYASVGANGVGLPVIIDGLNEAGLAAGLFYFPTTAGYMALHPGGRRQDHRALAARLVDPRQFRQRRRGQGQYRLDPRRRDGAQAMGLLAACPRHRPRRLGQEHRHRICRRQAQRLRQSAWGHHQFAGLRLADDQSQQLCELLARQPSADPAWVGQARAVRPGLGDAGHAGRLHAALALRARRRRSASPSSSRKPATKRFSRPFTSSTTSTSRRARRARRRRTSMATSSPTTRSGRRRATSRRSDITSAPTRTAASAWST